MSDEDSFDERPRARRSFTLGWLLLIGAIIAAIVLGNAPSPYAVERPGPVFDTLGNVQVDGATVPLIDIPDETVYPTDGTLDLLTVYIDGSPQEALPWLDVVTAWFDPSEAVIPLDAIYPAGQTQEQADEASALAMTDSQQYAIAAALGELGMDYTSTVSVADVVAGQPADGVLQKDDLVLTVNGTAVANVDELRARIGESGVGVPLTLGIRRDGTDLDVAVTPVASDRDGSAIIGVLAGAVFDFPIDVRIQLERVGGPSAGMMFALGIYDKLTPGALTGGERVAGTGTIAPDGTVGAIGGIVQKMYGAKAAGARWFLAPADNCSEVVGHVPGELGVFSVADLNDAITALDAIAAGDTSDLPTCER